MAAATTQRVRPCSRTPTHRACVPVVGVEPVEVKAPAPPPSLPPLLPLPRPRQHRPHRQRILLRLRQILQLPQRRPRLLSQQTHGIQRPLPLIRLSLGVAKAVAPGPDIASGHLARTTTIARVIGSALLENVTAILTIEVGKSFAFRTADQFFAFFASEPRLLPHFYLLPTCLYSIGAKLHLHTRLEANDGPKQ